MIRIAICDDDAKELEEAYLLVQKYCMSHTEQDISVQKFDIPARLMESIEEHGRYDIYILDIVMPEMNGIELGAEIREKDNECKIILLTISTEYGVDSYSIAANDYILKPVREKLLYSSIDKALYSLTRENAKRYLINIPGGMYAIPYGRLLYIEYYKHRLIARTVDGEMIESNVLRQSFTNLISELLEDGRFVRISSAHIVNMQYIRKVSARNFELSNGEILAVSRRYSEARNRYLDYMVNVMRENNIDIKK